MIANWIDYKPFNGVLEHNGNKKEFKDFDRDLLNFKNDSRRYDLSILLASLNPDSSLSLKEDKTFFDSVFDKASKEYQLLKKSNLVDEKFTGIVHYPDSNFIDRRRSSSILGSKLALESSTVGFRHSKIQADPLLGIKNNATFIFSRLDFIYKIDLDKEFL